RGNELRRLINREGHQRDVPSGHATGKLGILLAAQIVNILRFRERCWINLSNRPDHDDRPVRPRNSHLSNKVEVDALIDHAIIAEYRPWQVRLLGAHGSARARAGKMRYVNAGWKGMNVTMLMLLRLKDA